MDTIAIRSFETLTYLDPEPILVKLREIECELAKSSTPAKIKALRTNSLKEFHELREAALFCHFVGQRIGTIVYLAKKESQDYDFVASWVNEGFRNYAPVQIKEVVPEITNKDADISTIIDKLNRYVDSKNLIVAVHLNRQCYFSLNELKIPELGIKQLWIFGAMSPDQNSWCLWGDFCDVPIGTKHDYPVY